MSAVFAEITPGPESAIEVTARAAEQDSVLTPAALDLLAALHRLIEPQRQARLAARVQRQAFFDAGGLPDFRDDTRAIREGDWQVAPPRSMRLDPKLA